MDALLIWLALIIPAMLWGILCAFIIKFRFAGFISGAVPWLVLLGFILYTEYLTPYEGGGASMWPIAQLFGGTIAAVVGFQSYKICMSYFVKKK